jgi:glycosyltransferase involved in cell wall biosynthesis
MKLYSHCWIVIPAYQEADLIGTVVRQVRQSFPHVVVVDDGSTDDTAQQAAAAGATVLRHLINLGQGAALQTGIAYALQRGADYLVTFDADGQHRLEDVEKMLAILCEQQLDVVLGSRFLGQTIGMSWGRWALLQVAIWFTRLTTGLPLTDAHNGLRVFSRQAAQQLRLRQNQMAHASEILEQIAQQQMKYAEVGNTIAYTEYSRGKGQKASSAIHILVDLFIGRLSK